MNDIICVFWELIGIYKDKSNFNCKYVGNTLASIRINHPWFNDTFEQDLLNSIEEESHEHVDCNGNCEHCRTLFKLLQVSD